jgi:hypothetical protein
LNKVEILADQRLRLAVPVGGGFVDLCVDHARLPLDVLCDFAARRNIRRGFLILSRVLGRHVPSRPRDMQAAVSALTDQLVDAEPEMTGPVLFVGLAETAICLGQSVFQDFRERTGRSDALFTHSTRQQVDAEVMARFEEPHSHASAHLIYYPHDTAHRVLAASARTLVLVDDEITTGTTLRNLSLSILQSCPHLENIYLVSLTDWSGDADLLSFMPLPTACISLLSGTLIWRPRSDGHPHAASFPVVARAALGRLENSKNFGRLGSQTKPEGSAALASSLVRDDSERFLILGTGEFTYAPYLLGLALEALGHDVIMQATTRSPIQVGGAISSALTFGDNYGTGVPNYLYNSDSAVGRRVLICHETPVGSIDPILVDAMSAECLYFGDDQ